MPTQNLLYKSCIDINEDIRIMIPKVGDIIDAEDEYYTLVTILTAMPIDFIAQLHESGIDFSEINDYDLFLRLFPALRSYDTSLIFGDLCFDDFKYAVNEQNNTIVLVDERRDIVIDRAIHGMIADTLRKIHHLEKDMRKPGNEEAKKFMIERAMKKLKRNKNRKHDSQLESLIIAMVNTEQYKYDFEGTRELSIYQFNESVRQIINKIDYEHRMTGIYAGTIDVKNLSTEDLNWISNK